MAEVAVVVAVVAAVAAEAMVAAVAVAAEAMVAAVADASWIHLHQQRRRWPWWSLSYSFSPLTHSVSP